MSRTDKNRLGNKSVSYKEQGGKRPHYWRVTGTSSRTRSCGYLTPVYPSDPEGFAREIWGGCLPWGREWSHFALFVNNAHSCCLIVSADKVSVTWQFMKLLKFLQIVQQFMSLLCRHIRVTFTCILLTLFNCLYSRIIMRLNILSSWSQQKNKRSIYYNDLVRKCVEMNTISRYIYLYIRETYLNATVLYTFTFTTNNCQNM